MIRWLAIVALIFSGRSAVAESPADPDVLATEAATVNPSLQASREAASMLDYRAAVAGTWMDPMLTVEYSNVPLPSLSLADSPMAGLQLKAQQTLPPPGWSALRRAAAEGQADAADRATDEAVLALQAAVHRAYWQLARTRILQGITERHVAQTDELLGSVRARFEVGGAGQHAVLRLTVLRDRLSDDLDDFNRDAALLVAGLDQALSSSTGATYPTPTSIAPLPAPADADWLALATKHRPELARLATERRAAEDSAALARRDGWPDLTVWAGYRARFDTVDMGGDTDLVAAGIGVPLPSGSLRRARADEAAWQAGARRAAEAGSATEDAIVAEMTRVLARWRRAAAKAELYRRSLIPEAESTLESAQADYAVGRADFASLYDADIALLDLERAAVVAVTETRIARADALAAIGIFPEEPQR